MELAQDIKGGGNCDNVREIISVAVDIGKVLSDVNSLIRNTTLNLANVGFR